MTFARLATILLGVAAVAAIGWAAAGVALSYLRPRGSVRGVEAALLSIGGFVAFAVAAMVLHIVSGGAVFGTTWGIPLLALALVVLWWRRGRGVGEGLRRPPWTAVVLAAALATIYVLPVVLAGSGVRTGDPPWHLGWTEQLLAGEPVPTGPAPEFGRNAYPWGLHAVMASIVRVIPGAGPLDALESLHIVTVVAIPLAAAALARRVVPQAGLAAAYAAALVGGFGWLAAGGPDFVASPVHARYGADLVVASPNSVYELFPPGLPRELGLALLGCAGVLLITARGDRRRALAAGVTAGLTGLVSVPMFVAACAWGLGAAAADTRARRDVATAGLAALATFALWAGPVAGAWVRHGGFVNITPTLGKEWPLLQALASWGLLFPLAVAGGAYVAKARRDESNRLILGFAGAAIVVLAASLARGAFDWGLAGNATLLHQGRVWPVLHLIGAALGGIAVWRMWTWAKERGRLVAPAGLGAIVLAAASPALAAIRVTEILEEGRSGFIYGTPDLAEESFVRAAAARLGPDDVVRVDGPPHLAFLLFQFSGCRLTGYDDPALPANDLRIRYRHLAQGWQRAEAAESFSPDYLVIPAEPGASEGVARGIFAGSEWILVPAGARL